LFTHNNALNTGGYKNICNCGHEVKLQIQCNVNNKSRAKYMVSEDLE